MTELTEDSEVRRIADRDSSVERVVADRTGLEKPVTYSGTANTDDRFCALCTYAQSARFLAPGYRDGTPVCTTHARALVSGDWEHGEQFEVVSLERISR